MGACASTPSTAAPLSATGISSVAHTLSVDGAAVLYTSEGPKQLIDGPKERGDAIVAVSSMGRASPAGQQQPQQVQQPTPTSGAWKSGLSPCPAAVHLRLLQQVCMEVRSITITISACAYGACMAHSMHVRRVLFGQHAASMRIPLHARVQRAVITLHPSRTRWPRASACTDFLSNGTASGCDRPASTIQQSTPRSPLLDLLACACCFASVIYSPQVHDLQQRLVDLHENALLGLVEAADEMARHFGADVAGCVADLSGVG